MLHVQTRFSLSRRLLTGLQKKLFGLSCFYNEDTGAQGDTCWKSFGALWQSCLADDFGYQSGSSWCSWERKGLIPSSIQLFPTIPAFCSWWFAILLEASPSQCLYSLFYLHLKDFPQGDFVVVVMWDVFVCVCWGGVHAHMCACGGLRKALGICFYWSSPYFWNRVSHWAWSLQFG